MATLTPQKMDTVSKKRSPKKPELDPIREGIKSELEKRGMTAHALALELGLSYPTVYRFLQGSRGIEYGNLVKIIQYLELSISGDE